MVRVLLSGFVLAGAGLAWADAGGDKKKPDKAPGTRVFMGGFTQEKGAVVDLGIIVVGAKSSKAEYYDVNKATKFVFVDGDTRKVLNHKTVLTDPDGKEHFKMNIYITLEAKGKVARTVTFSPARKKGDGKDKDKEKDT
jgi:hypothetical protein